MAEHDDVFVSAAGADLDASGAVNPTLTIIANALRVADRLLEPLRARLGSEVDTRRLDVARRGMVSTPRPKPPAEPA